MSKKINMDFLAAFIELEGACNRLLDKKRSGVTEYINRLEDSGAASRKDELFKKLIFYRKIRNKLAHEEGALDDLNDVDKTDVKWLGNFRKKVEKGRDPLSLHIKKADRRRLWSIVKITAIASVIVAVIIIAIVFALK